jgi:hypothetical protein
VGNLWGREHARRGAPLVESHADKLESIADGQALALAPAGGGNITFRNDLTAIPVGEIEPCKVVIVTRADKRSRLVTAFRESAELRRSPPTGRATCTVIHASCFGFAPATA